MTDDARLTRLATTLPSTVPFVGPEALERISGTAFAARLGANESGFGPSPLAIKAMQDTAPDAWMYADPESHDLRNALAKHHDINPANIMVGEGIDGLLGLLVRLMVSEGDHVVTSAGAYPTFNYHVAGFGGTLHTVPYVGDSEDPARLIAKAKETGAKLIYIANPDNPMGTYHKAPEIERMIESIPEGCLLILDEAYIELAPQDAAPDIAPDDPRVIRMRTFSKGYGMAGARVGYAVGHSDLINAFNKVRNHFGMNRISQAGALAALADEAYLGDVIARVQKSRNRIAAIALDNGLSPIPSATNFMAIDCGKGGDFAKRVVTELGRLGVFVRMPFVAPQNRCIRVSCGPAMALDLFADALPKALKSARS
ncbi:MAG: histidinol-phosphate aminotransferase [Gammaproteobacteria bacterium]|jgi:histidinol-phosphate aminotransferase